MKVPVDSVTTEADFNFIVQGASLALTATAFCCFSFPLVNPLSFNLILV